MSLSEALMKLLRKSPLRRLRDEIDAWIDRWLIG